MQAQRIWEGQETKKLFYLPTQTQNNLAKQNCTPTETQKIAQLNLAQTEGALPAQNHFLSSNRQFPELLIVAKIGVNFEAILQKTFIWYDPMITIYIILSSHSFWSLDSTSKSGS